MHLDWVFSLRKSFFFFLEGGRSVCLNLSTRDCLIGGLAGKNRTEQNKLPSYYYLQMRINVNGVNTVVVAVDLRGMTSFYIEMQIPSRRPLYLSIVPLSYLRYGIGQINKYTSNDLSVMMMLFFSFFFLPSRHPSPSTPECALRGSGR